METEFANRLEKRKEIEARMTNALEERQEYIKELEQMKNAYKLHNERAAVEIENSKHSHEEEVQLRLKFENKMNKINQIYKDLQQRVSNNIIIV